MRNASRWLRPSVLAELWPGYGKVWAYSTSMRVTAFQPFCIQSFQNIITWAHSGLVQLTLVNLLCTTYQDDLKETRKAYFQKTCISSGWTGTKRNHFEFRLIAVAGWTLPEKLGSGALSSARWEQGFLEDVITKMNLKMCVRRCPRKRKKAFYNRDAKHVYKDAKHAVYLSPTDDSACESTAKKKKKETST